MIPYRGRLSLRIARTALALACLAWYGLTAGFHLNLNALTALLTAYAVFSLGSLPDIRSHVDMQAAIALLADTAYFALWVWIAPGGWMPSLLAGYLLASAAILHDFARTVSVTVVALILALALPMPPALGLDWTVFAAGAISIGISLYKRYLDQRMSAILRYNVIIRSQAEGAREAERQRIAADFHDGPLQSFISFQMRLEVIKKLMTRDLGRATDELVQLQELCQSQVADLRSFVRSMRPADEGMSLSASLSKMVESFQRDTGITATFSAGEFPDPSATEVALELLQIVRETLTNIQKHSGASRVAVSAARSGESLVITVEDNGSGFPFGGSFSLNELESLHLGPISIKRRVRMLGGDLTLESKPSQGAKLAIRVAT
jgi:signal transduction histidine kinase